MFGKRFKKGGGYARKRIGPKAVAKKAVRAAARSAFAKKVLAVVARKEETKYVSAQLLQGVTIGQGFITPVDFKNCLTPLTQGVGDFQRIGEQVTPVKARVDFTFNWTNEQSNNQDVVVNLWIVTVKGYDSRGAIPNTPGGQFLNVGDGTNRDPNDPSQPLMLQGINHMPLNKDQYTSHKHYRFRMRRGTGAQANQGPATIIAPTGVLASEDQRYMSYTWTPPVLKYNAAGDQFPTKHYPVFAYYATNADGSAYGDTLHISARTHLWFKDA